MWAFLRRRSLTQWVMFGMVAGALVGWLAPDTGVKLQPLATIFLRLIKSIIAPLIFATLVAGIAGHGDDLKKIGRLAFRAIVYFEIVTTVALFVGLVMVNWLRPGVGVAIAAGAGTPGIEARQTSASDILIHTFPQSFFEAAANNDILQVVVWSILFGAALTLVQGKAKDTVLAFCNGVAEVMFKFTAIVMRYAPVAVFGAIGYTVGQGGVGVLARLGALILTLYAALVVFIGLVLVPVMWITRVPVRPFLRAIKDPALLAFSTASSEAALPLAMERIEEMGVPRRISAFVLPLGYTFNLDGSTLYLAVASIFVAQAAGVHLSLGQQLMMMLTLMLTSKGMAGVPRAAIVILAGTVAQFNLPLEGVAIIFGVDQLMDMARTAVNLVGNSLAGAVMARWEGEAGWEAKAEAPAASS